MSKLCFGHAEEALCELYIIIHLITELLYIMDEQHLTESIK